MKRRENWNGNREKKIWHGRCVCERERERGESLIISLRETAGHTPYSRTNKHIHAHTNAHAHTHRHMHKHLLHCFRSFLIIHFSILLRNILVCVCGPICLCLIVSSLLFYVCVCVCVSVLEARHYSFPYFVFKGNMTLLLAET